MIEKMNKLYLLIHNKSMDSVLSSLQNLGVVHIQQQNTNVEQFQEIFQQERRVKDLLKYCEKYQGPSKKLTKSIHETLDNFEETLRQIEKLNSEKNLFLKDLNYLRPWGNFKRETLLKLKKSGFEIFFYIINQSQMAKLDLKGIDHEIVNQESGQVYLVTIGKKLDLEQVLLPETDTFELNEKIKKINSEIAQKIELALSFGAFKKDFDDHLLKSMDQLAYSKAKQGLSDHFESFSSAIGWIPDSLFSQFEKEAKKIEGIAFIVEKNLKNEDSAQIPILLKNSQFSKLFEPITKLFALPHYAEFDLTPFFAPFFMMFFGLCMGDTGYGFVMLLGSLFALVKGPKTMKPIFTLLLLLSLSTIFWGTLTGTTFGMDLFKVQIPLLSSLATFTSDHTFYLALLIGLLQILFGMVVQMFNRIHQGSWMNGLSTFGWMNLVIFMAIAYLAGQPIPEKGFAIGIAVLEFSHSVPALISKWGMIGGAVLILLFNDLKANIFVRVGKGLWELYGITGIFGDLLSYIRLFALGISSAILGTVINSIGSQFLEIGIPVVSHIIFLAFIIVGHSANLGLSMLGSFVHPLRLTFVEFYKNAGFSGGGKAYSPLKKNFTNN